MVINHVSKSWEPILQVDQESSSAINTLNVASPWKIKIRPSLLKNGKKSYEPKRIVNTVSPGSPKPRQSMIEAWNMYIYIYMHICWFQYKREKVATLSHYSTLAVVRIDHDYKPGVS